MKPIPPAMRRDLEKEPRMKKCPLSGVTKYLGQCSGPLQWHHVWIYARNQINEKWAIVSPCETHHDMVKTNRKVRSALEIFSLSLATPADLAKYPRKEWSTAYMTAASNLTDRIIGLIR